MREQEYKYKRRRNVEGRRKVKWLKIRSRIGSRRQREYARVATRATLHAYATSVAESRNGDSIDSSREWFETKLSTTLSQLAVFPPRLRWSHFSFPLPSYISILLSPETETELTTIEDFLVSVPSFSIDPFRTNFFCFPSFDFHSISRF